MSTIKEVSRLAGVSISTVSRVLNESGPVSSDTREKVMSVVDELDYKPNAMAQALVTNKSNGIGVIVNEIASPFYNGIISGIEKTIESEGMHLVVSSGHNKRESEKEALEFLKQGRSDGIIIQFDACSDLDFLDWTTECQPFAIVGRFIPELADSCVFIDNDLGGQMATDYLISKGHKHIAHISGPLGMQDSRYRWQGYQTALRNAGLTVDDRYFVESDFQEKGGYRATKRLLERNLDVTAIFAGNDQMAAGALKALREENLSVPDDISLIGYDDVMLAQYLYPSLTSIRQPLLEIGQAAANLVLKALGKKDAEVKNKFEPVLIERNSVATLS